MSIPKRLTDLLAMALDVGGEGKPVPSDGERDNAMRALLKAMRAEHERAQALDESPAVELVLVTREEKARLDKARGAHGGRSDEELRSTLDDDLSEALGEGLGAFVKSFVGGRRRR